MIPLFRPQQVRDMDARAFARGVEPLALMERAAGHLARTIVRAGGHGYGLRVGLLCGRGNNGGDGLAAARRLQQAGARSTVVLPAGEAGLSGDALAQLDRWRASGGTLGTTLAEMLADSDVLVDCLLGTGASGEPREPYGAAIRALNGRSAHDVPVVACDLPSGVDADTGQVPGVAVRADVTLTLGAHKRGLHLWPARGRCGELVLGELGIVDESDEPAALALERRDVAALLPPPDADAHKYEAGTLAVFAGSAGMSGAATLVARGALAAGAGLVTVYVPGSAQVAVAAAVPEALTVALPEDDPRGAFEQVAAGLAQTDAAVIGPGLGTAEPTVAAVRRLVAEVGCPIVLDADGLNAFRSEGDALTDHRSGLLVLTPHEREFGRLITDSASGRRDLWAARSGAVPQHAAAWNAVVVAKGPGTLIAAPDGRCWVNPTGSAALATGGTGDVLAGMLGTLVAQRPAAESVAAGVWVHGRAGQLAGRGRAARSVTALDVSAAVPAALEELEAS